MERKQIGLRIKKIREDLGDTQAEFADRFSRTQQAVGKWESGLTMPDGETMVAILELGRDRLPTLSGAEELPETFRNGLGREIKIDEAVAMMTDIMTGPQIYKAALVSSVKALFKACKNEAEMEGMRGEMKGLGQKLDTLIAIVTGLQKGAEQAANG